jgi:cytoskeletal protein CcmA (bactofilin family)
MRRVIIWILIAMAIVWGSSRRESAFADPQNINGGSFINGPLAVHGALTVDGPAVIHGEVRAHKINVNGPMVATLPHTERVGEDARQFASATTIHGPLKVRGSLDVDGELTVNGPLICEKAHETPMVASAENAAVPSPAPERNVFGFSELQHALGLPLK